MTELYFDPVEVSTHSRPKAAGFHFCDNFILVFQFQHTAARRRLARQPDRIARGFRVSTHSRPKAAGTWKCRYRHRCDSFNTQPPEGGWFRASVVFGEIRSFNTQPPEGGWVIAFLAHIGVAVVSTHSRPKAAGENLQEYVSECKFQHTAARRRLVRRTLQTCLMLGFNTQPPEGGWHMDMLHTRLNLFQHTAARRRLAPLLVRPAPINGFNTQPPEGGWLSIILGFLSYTSVSTHSRPKAAGATRLFRLPATRFQHTAARRRLAACLWGLVVFFRVSTHSRPKAAGMTTLPERILSGVSTHSRPKAAGPPIAG